jgi:hypothetical protein
MKSVSDANRKYGKLFLVVSSVVLWVVILFLFKSYGYSKTWKLWRVPVLYPQFSDFRLIPGSAESFRMGYEPTRRNPGDPYGRIFNYPAFWRFFFYTGITEADTVWVVSLMLALFFLGIFIFPHDISMVDSLVLLLIIFSPASMLLYERGNVDLIVFFLCALVVWLAEYSAIAAAILLMFAIVVKIFPFFGCTVLLKAPKLKFVWLSVSCLAVLLVYIYVTSGSMKASWNLTMRGDKISYGADVLFQHYEKYLSSLLKLSPTAPILKFGPIILATILIVLTGMMGLRSPSPLASTATRNLAAFRMGASIYVGTFLLGNNWDYRLAFLIFVLPQLLEWTRSSYSRQYRLISTSVLVMVFASCWHLMVWSDPALAGIREILFVLDEVMNWVLVAGFSYLIAASMPGWAREILPFMSSKRDVLQTT